MLMDDFFFSNPGINQRHIAACKASVIDTSLGCLPLCVKYLKFQWFWLFFEMITLLKLFMASNLHNYHSVETGIKIIFKKKKQYNSQFSQSQSKSHSWFFYICIVRINKLIYSKSQSFSTFFECYRTSNTQPLVQSIGVLKH